MSIFECLINFTLELDRHTPLKSSVFWASVFYSNPGGNLGLRSWPTHRSRSPNRL